MRPPANIGNHNEDRQTSCSRWEAKDTFFLSPDDRWSRNGELWTGGSFQAHVQSIIGRREKKFTQTRSIFRWRDVCGMDSVLGRMRTCFSSCFFSVNWRVRELKVYMPLPIDTCECGNLHRNEHQLIWRTGGKRVNDRIFSSLSELQHGCLGQVMQSEKGSFFSAAPFIQHGELLLSLKTNGFK